MEQLVCYGSFVSSIVDANSLVDISRRLLSDGNHNGATVVSRAGVVLLCGSFEGFVRESVDEYLEIINGCPEHTISDAIWCWHIEEKALAYRQNDLQAMSSLISSLRGSSRPVLRKNKEHKTAGNPSVDTIEKIYGSLGIPRVIDRLSIVDYEVDTTFTEESQIDSSLKRKLDEVLRGLPIDHVESTKTSIVRLIDDKWRPKKKRRKVGYVSAIEELLKLRNRIAHGEGWDPITPDDLKGHIDAISKLAEGINSILTNELQSAVSREET